jgi:CheY-like chemotaxis protein/anti-sigma regulatory factor (Ser/Thr protein kinase)
LVIDPCRETHASIVSFVQGRDLSIIAVSDPIAALAAIDKSAPDIVITEMFLPDGAGLALMTELRSSHEFCPVIVMAKDAPAPVIVQALREGAVDYLHKPIAEEELAQALYRARHLLPGNMTDLSGVGRSEHRLTVDSDPAHVPGVISWLMKTTASMLSEIQRLRLRGTLQELLMNAVEHGNLEIPYRVKQQAVVEGKYESLIGERLAQPRLKNRQVAIHVLYEKEAKSLVYRIADEGAGFQWRSMLNQSQDAGCAEAGSGRGIFLTRSFFPSLAYNDRGNEVTFTVPLA